MGAPLLSPFSRTGEARLVQLTLCDGTGGRTGEMGHRERGGRAWPRWEGEEATEEESRERTDIFEGGITAIFKGGISV